MTKKMKFLAFALIAVLTCVGFASCGDDDEEPKGDELSSIIVGDWAQDGDSDLLRFNADGTGSVWALIDPEWNWPLTWTCENDWLYIDILWKEEHQIENCRPESVSKDKIVWRRYEANPNLPADLDYLEKDAFGYYELWTWERYTK